MKYHLYGIVNHYGGLDCGHYTATVRNKYDKKWYLYEDSVVSETEEIITKHAYILFYERKES